MTVAGDLVRAFGDVERMAKLYAPNICWSLSASLISYPRPMQGREAVIAFNTHVWGEVYHPDCWVEILDETGDAATSAARFIYSATLIASGQTYQNEYTLFARSGPDGITHVFEGLDTAALLDFINARDLGASFEQMGSARHPSRGTL